MSPQIREQLKYIAEWGHYANTDLIFTYQQSLSLLTFIDNNMQKIEIDGEGPATFTSVTHSTHTTFKP